MQANERRRQMRQLTVALGICALFAVALAGCGGRSDEAPPTSVAQEAAAAGIPAEATLPPAQTPPAQTPPVADAAVPEPAAPARQANDGEIYVDLAAFQRRVNPLVHGATWGPLWPVSPQMMPRLQELGISVLSFPGGEYGDTTDLQQIEIDRFIELCRTLGAEPLIHVRLPNGTPEKALAILSYANQQKGYGVKYWAIGNEPNLYPGKYTDTPWDPAYFAEAWRRIAEPMKAADPSILLIGPEVTQFAGTNGVTRSDELEAADWIRTFLEVNGDLVDIVSIHRYPFPRDIRTITTADDLMANPPEWDERILPDLRAMMRETVGRELPIAVTEINSHWSRAQRQEATPDTLLNAIWWGDVFMRMLREGVDMVTFWSLTSRDDQGVWGIVGKYGERPTYGTFALYAKFGHDLVHADVGGDAGEWVGALASRREDGKVTLMLSNRDAAAQTLQLAVEGGDAGEGDAALRLSEMWRVDAEHLGTQVEGEMPQVGGTLTLPPHSLTLLVLE